MYSEVDPVHPPTLASRNFYPHLQAVHRRDINFFSTNNYSTYSSFKNHGWSPELASSPHETKLFMETIGQALGMRITRGSVSE